MSPSVAAVSKFNRIRFASLTLLATIVFVLAIGSSQSAQAATTLSEFQSSFSHCETVTNTYMENHGQDANDFTTIANEAFWAESFNLSGNGSYYANWVHLYPAAEDAAVHFAGTTILKLINDIPTNSDISWTDAMTITAQAIEGYIKSVKDIENAC